MGDEWASLYCFVCGYLALSIPRRTHVVDQLIMGGQLRGSWALDSIAW